MQVYRREQAVVIRFVRPEIRNPLSVAVIEGLMAELSLIGSDTAIERVVFTGSENVFASGADLREISKVTAANAREFAEMGQRLMRTIAQMKPVSVAAVNGFCYGGALDLALACDHRVASPTATFAHPGVDLGIMTGWGGTQRLPRLIGEAAALEMFMTARPITAAEAAAIGLVENIDEDVVTAALSI